MKKLAFLVTLLCSNLCLATPLTVTGSSAELNGVSLKKISSAVRQKKILFIGIDVYRVTLFGSDETFARDPEGTKALDSLKGMKAYGLQLELLRALKAQDIADGFDTALKENAVKDSPALEQFKAAIRDGGDMESGGIVTISVDTQKSLLIGKQGNKVFEIKGDANFFRDVFSIWLGKPADNGLAALRDGLIKGA